MLTSEDCLALAGLTVAEVDRIGARERLPWIVALELASHPLETADGWRRLRRILGEDTGWCGPATADGATPCPGVTGPETEQPVA